MRRVPFAKPGKDSMDLEVFGMAGVPEGAMPGVPPPDGKQTEACDELHHACMMPGTDVLTGTNVYTPHPAGLFSVYLLITVPLHQQQENVHGTVHIMTCPAISHLSYWLAGRCSARAC